MGKCGSKLRSECPLPMEKHPRPSVEEESERQGGLEVSEASPVGKTPTLLERLADASPSMSWGQASTTSPICKATLIIGSDYPIERHYHMEKNSLRIGAHGSVCKGSHILSGVVRAVKTIPKSHAKEVQYVIQEIATLKLLDHPNIVKLYETFESVRSIRFVMDLCSGGPLMDRIGEVGHFTEVQASVVIHQIMHAVNYMHVTHHLCHRDLNLDSVFFAEKNLIEQSMVKLTNFGFATAFEKGQMMTTRVGSMHYMSPQVLAGRYDESCDIWSVGVMTYVLLCGYSPFDGENEPDVLAKLKKGSVCFDTKEWNAVSKRAKDFILKLMKMDAHNRYTTQQALSDAWVKNRAPKASDFNLDAGFLDHLRCFGGTNYLKRTVLHIISGQLALEHTKMLHDIFVVLDLDGDGLITESDLREFMRQGCADDLPADFAAIVEAVAGPRSGGIDYNEFLAASLEKKHYLKESVCWKAFSIFDRDGDGHISIEDLKHVLNSRGLEEVGPEVLEQLMNDFDYNGDGLLNFEEFMLMMLRNCSPRRGDHTSLKA